ncbi:MAG: PmoA family protein [Planctomycetota bacterium]
MRPHLTLAAVLVTFTVAQADAAQFTVEKDDKGVTVQCDGQLFTRYIEKSGAKPIFWPVLGATGKRMTRGYPMRDPLETEKKDHVHHRSLWFDHGDVNGISFWHESGNHGTIEHREYLQLEGGKEAVIRTRNDWRAPDGEVLCQDVRTMTFGAAEGIRWIDFNVEVTATQDQVVFGDTKEGSFGMRVAGSMRAELENGGKILNSEGQTDRDAWGKRASWVDYSGPVDGETVGVAILNHPNSFRYPTYWHVRTYGLFAANPFGWHDFRGSNDVDGSLTLKKGESFQLFYRVLLHPGNAEDANIAEAFQRYADEPVNP